VAAALQIVQAGATRFCHPQETEARRLECDAGNRFGYNAQAVVDAQERIIVAAETVSAENDLGQLNFMLQQAEANLGSTAAATATVADGGYCAGAQIQAAQAAGRDVYSPVPCQRPGGAEAPYHTMHFEHDPASDTVRCPQGQALTFRRERTRERGLCREYRAAGAVCRVCPAFGTCTRDRHGRGIELWAWTPAMQQHRAKMATRRAAEIYAQRSQIIEPVFGWIKEAWHFRRWTWRGLQKVAAQWHLLCATTNLRALYRAWVGTATTACPGAVA
jgi:transposase